MTRACTFAVLLSAGVLAGAAAPFSRAEEPVLPILPPAQTVTVDRLVDGHPASFWRARSARNHRWYRQQHRDSLARGRTIARLKRTLAHSPTVTEALQLARVVYGVDLSRRVNCESHGYPGAHNPSGASGLLQFLPSTWASTPFGSLSVWSPYASALAGGWMVAKAGRSGEWTCGL